jgi:hypothetical protein
MPKDPSGSIKVFLQASKLRVKAVGVWLPDRGIIVKNGSRGNLEEFQSSTSSTSDLREHLLQIGVIRRIGEDGFEFLQDFQFEKPSGASSFLLNGSVLTRR